MRSRLGPKALVATVVLVVAPVVQLPTAAAQPVPVTPMLAEVDLSGAGTSATGVEVPEGAAVLGVTWRGAGTPAVEVRALGGGGAWGDWVSVPATDDGPDAVTAEAGNALAAGGTRATDPVDVLGADRVEVRAAEAAGVQDLRAVVVSPGSSPADALAGASAGPVATAGADATRPDVVTREEWGADESLRNCEPDTKKNLKGVIVHHTADRNSYSPAQAPVMVRSIYAYHTQVQKWCDVGYNALIDRFGTIYEGRSGGVDENVIGAHAAGFNTGTWGVSVIGNFDVDALPAAAQASLERIIAWKLGDEKVDPTDTMRMTSGGSPKYAEGTKVTLPVIAAHRDVGLTACPGQYYYDRLDEIRANVAALSADDRR